MPKKINLATPAVVIPEQNQEEPIKLERTECENVKADQFEKDPNKSVKFFSIVPQRKWRKIEKEARFLENPNYSDYLSLVKCFAKGFNELGNNSYEGFEEILIVPQNKGKKDKACDFKRRKFHEHRLRKWHEKKEMKFEKKLVKSEQRSEKRARLIREKGPGFPGFMTNNVHNGKMVGRNIKDYASVRGNMFRMSNLTCGYSLFELLPRYGVRNGGYIAIRVSEFVINTTFMAAGFGLLPISWGVSPYVANAIRTFVTVCSETGTFELLGAHQRKVAFHAATRAVQMQGMRMLPVVGDAVYYTEIGVQNVGNGVIALSYILDMIMKNNGRYASILTKRDLGDSRVLGEMEKRIDYLSRFLIPHGQWLLLNEENDSHRKKLRKLLKKQSKILRDLEKKRTNALNFYQLALIGNRVPKKMLDDVMRDTVNASVRPLKNCDRIARKCLATLMETRGYPPESAA